MSNKLPTMDELLAGSELLELKVGDVVEGTIISTKKHEIWLDLGAHGIGVVMRREAAQGQSQDVGETISASVVDPEMDEGHVLLSMRKAVKEKGWEELEALAEAQSIVEVTPYDANRGGLLIELEGIRGFMPVSQLAAQNYPRVSGADKDEILQKLNALVGRPMKARVLDVSRKDNKLIFSEKEAMREVTQERFSKLKVGDKVEGTITGVIDFGAFVNVEGIEGLIHISEISWERVEDPRKYVKVGEQVKAKIIAVDKDRLSLSIKQMSDDPWLKDVEDIKKGAQIEGTITRITPFGAFVQITPSVEALVHISELGEGESADPEKVFKLHEKKKFTVLEVDKENRKISLSLKNKK